MAEPDLCADFDRITELSLASADQPGHYDARLLELVPAGCRRALEVGCGMGGFTRRLAGRAAQVTAIDLSPGSVRVARERSAGLAIDYEVADVRAWQPPAQGFDCVVSIATLHHLPFEATLARLAGMLRPGGVLIVHDLFASGGWRDGFASALAWPVARLARWAARAPRPSPELRRAWREHGQRDVLMTIPALRHDSARVLPGSRLTRHLLWRYTLVWQRR
jgi:SAM-dependent methyltransferase